MSTLDRCYTECCNHLGWQPRPLIKTALSEFEKLYDTKNSAVCFLQLPTGYGKSTITLALGKDVLNGGKFGQRVIHVLPLRSIIHDLRGRLADWFKKLNLDYSKISSQYMGSAGSPFFANKVVVTTLDTFSLNLFKLPASEISNAFKYGNAHFESARGFIYSSVAVFDEAHLFALDQGEYRQVFTVFALCLKQLARTGVPLFIITATLPKPIKQFFQKRFLAEGIFYVDKVYSQGSDPIFEASSGKRVISTSIISKDEEALRIIHNNLDKRILIIVNEVSRAVQFYRELKSHNPILLHGKMVEKERKDNVEKMEAHNKNNKKWIVIGTQVVEAGIDVDAKLLISDLAPMDRLVQRIGRVARYGGKGEVYILENYSTVYQDRDLKTSKSLLPSGAKEINWTTNAQELVDKAYSNFRPTDMIDSNLENYLTSVDESLMSGVKDMMDLIDIIKSFPRETSLVKAYAPSYFTEGRLTEKDAYIAIDSLQALEILQHSKKVIKDCSIHQLDDNDLHRLLQNRNIPLDMTLEKEGFDGIILDRYEQRVGYI